MSSGKKGAALCLSGGGFRAAAFHLGAVRRFNELGLLSGLAALSGVSGGSLFLMHLAVRLCAWYREKPGPGSVFGEYESAVAVPFRRFLSRDLRTGVVLRGHLDRLISGRNRATERLASRLEADLGFLLLSELPERPQFFFNATNMENGVAFVFSRNRMGDYVSGFRAGGDASLALAAAASAAYPPVFPPLQVRKGSPRLSDGGIYDNLGLEPVWKSASALFVSDGGLPLPGKFGSGALPLLARTVDILLNQNGALRKRALLGAAARTKTAVAYWALAGSGRSGSKEGELYARVRTDLDGLRAAETAALENRGYLCAEEALWKWDRRRPRPPSALPHAGMTEADIGAALALSARRRWPWIPETLRVHGGAATPRE